MQWYFANNNERQGPVSDADFQRLIAQGIIRADTLVWRQGMANWQPYSQIAPSLPPPILPSPIVASAEPVTGAPEAVASPAAAASVAAPAPAWTPAATSAHPAFHYGGFWIRFVAKIIDGIILFPVGLVIGFVVRAFFFRSVPFEPGDPQFLTAILTQEAVLIPLSMLIAILYDLFFILKYSATPGKMALGLKVLRSDGSKLSAGRVIGRYFGEKINLFILDIGYIIAAFDDEKRALHDHLCDTRVVYKR